MYWTRANRVRRVGSTILHIGLWVLFTAFLCFCVTEVVFQAAGVCSRPWLNNTRLLSSMYVGTMVVFEKRLTKCSGMNWERPTFSSGLGKPHH